MMAIWVGVSAAELSDTSNNKHEFETHLETLALLRYVNHSRINREGIAFHQFQLSPAAANSFAPDYDTLQMNQRLHLDAQNNDDDLEREILLAMLLAPIPFKFPSDAELTSSVRIRKNVVHAARKTSLDFHTTEAERPAEYWTYHEDTGFTLLPGKSLITALQLATQPGLSGQLYSFSCYRATEYVILLGIAQELKQCNPPLHDKLQKQWETSAIMSGKFHDVFLQEYGSMEQPLPPKFYVPGDRLWFRNPDKDSAEITGYEGSWLIYLGCGMFANFWKHTSPYTLTGKCLEIYHWRNGVRRDEAGALHMDEDVVTQRVNASLQNPAEVENILKIMMRYRDPADTYQGGGCIDTTREYPRYACPGTADIRLTSALKRN